MANTIVMQREGDRLVTGPAWVDLLHKVPEGVELRVRITRARSLPQNNTYWGLLQWVIDNGPEAIRKVWPEPELLSDALQYETGYVREVRLSNGDVQITPMHKNFEDGMSQDQFNRYFDAAQILLTQWCGYSPLPLYLEYLREKGSKIA